MNLSADREPLRLNRMFKPVVGKPLVVVRAQPDSPGVVVADDAVLVQEVDRDPESMARAGARDGDVVLLAESASDRWLRTSRCSGVCSWPAFSGANSFHGGRELLRVEHRRQPGDSRGGCRAGVLELGSLALLPTLGRDEHHAVGGVGAVDRRGGRVAQHRDAGDVVRVQEVERVAPGADPAAIAERDARRRRRAARCSRWWTSVRESGWRSARRARCSPPPGRRDFILDQLLGA